jgi:hypothetical protein
MRNRLNLAHFTVPVFSYLMPRVNNVEDAKMEIDALLKERSLLRRLRVIVADEVKRLSGSNIQSPQAIWHSGIDKNLTRYRIVAELLR